MWLSYSREYNKWQMEYTCPYCNRPTTLTTPNYNTFWREININTAHYSNKKGRGLKFVAITCPNPSCKQLRLEVYLTSTIEGQYGTKEGKAITSWLLMPSSTAKPQPTYIPRPIVQDYTEACLILTQSPKASATLARRCLQGMIRDFHGISRLKLSQEIDELEGKIPDAEWQAIDSLRKVGNIGAHMEKDVNLIIDIDQDEAEKLIAFIEYLFRQWYVKRHDDNINLAKVREIAGIKDVQRKGDKAAQS